MVMIFASPVTSCDILLLLLSPLCAEIAGAGIIIWKWRHTADLKCYDAAIDLVDIVSGVLTQENG